ncbi:MAG: hypothetical protein HZA20_13155 [Nitrospirae bacterium]|nr:hypothetical protein [Nitrospirota bacterium]
MGNRLSEILEEIRELEKAVQEEMRCKQEELKYRVAKGQVVFEAEIAELHRRLSQSLLLYVFGARAAVFLSAPVIYSLIVPAAMLDAGMTIYQSVCFPIYGIPSVKRSSHMIYDRQYLAYLNALEKLNCRYCSYMNGLFSYISEIAARTEQYWCPIKHASGRGRHSRYHLFLDYGDADAYKSRLDELRKKYEDAVE